MKAPCCCSLGPPMKRFQQCKTTNEAILMEGVGPPPWTPLLGLGFEMPSSKGVGEGTMALSGSPLPTVLVFQNQPRVGSAPWMGLGPSRRPALGCAATKLNFLAEFICSKRQIPPWEPRWLGPPCQIAQEFTTRRQTGSSRGIPLPSPQKEQEGEPLSLPGLGRRPTRYFRDPFPHPPGPPSLALELPGCWASG